MNISTMQLLIFILYYHIKFKGFADIIKTFSIHSNTTVQHQPFSTAWLLGPWGKGKGSAERAPRAAVASSRAPVSSEHTDVLWAQAR